MQALHLSPSEFKQESGKVQVCSKMFGFCITVWWPVLGIASLTWRSRRHKCKGLPLFWGLCFCCCYLDKRSEIWTVGKCDEVFTGHSWLLNTKKWTDWSMRNNNNNIDLQSYIMWLKMAQSPSAGRGMVQHCVQDVQGWLQRDSKAYLTHFYSLLIHGQTAVWRTDLWTPWPANSARP